MVRCVLVAGEMNRLNGNFKGQELHTSKAPVTQEESGQAEYHQYCTVVKVTNVTCPCVDVENSCLFTAEMNDLQSGTETDKCTVNTVTNIFIFA